MNSDAQLLKQLLPIAREAGDAIMEVYAAGAVATQKADGSPVTLADKRAEAIILAGLKRCAHAIPVVSEENAASHSLKPPERYFLVDPLDGTREFLKPKGQGSFTVNIALIENAAPRLGVVYAPTVDRMFSGLVGTGAWEAETSISCRPPTETGRVAVASVSHRDEQTDAWLCDNNITQTTSIGSSLKFCLLAAGEADVYPRFGPTMEWDTAAGHAVLSAAGGRLEHPDGEPFTYGKPEYRNGPFIAYARHFR